MEKMEVLREVGLSQGEIKVYSAVLRIGISTLNTIHEKTGIERRNIYDILNKLIEKGLVSYMIEKGKKTYQCTNPNKILEKIKEREQRLKELEKQLPEIMEVYESAKPRIVAETYRGKEGIKAIFEDILNYKEGHFIGGGWYVMDILPHYWKRYNKRRVEKGVKWYNLGRYELLKKKKALKLFYERYLPEEFSGNPVVTFIYGNKVVQVLWGEEFFAFMIESKELAENYRKYHKYLWDNVALKKQ